ncbi:MAG: glycosyltransferase [Actinobacteria bacterium]|nr:MAG: glycosyltransferase [Actinomycetota bacterium]
MPDGVSIVVPTVGRPSLSALLERLRPQVAGAPVPVELLVVPDTGRRGPAATRNVGWRGARYPWVAFLDDDVLPPADWLDRLLADLDQPADVGGVQGRLHVPVPGRCGDWAATTAALERASWATADMAYRRAALEGVGGFDERFPRAYREDADLAYRVRRAGWRLVVGTRRTTHPVRPESPWISLRTQRGNADDALLRRLHGPAWHRLLDAPAGRRHRHALVVAAGAAALAGPALISCRQAARVAGAAWLAGTVEFAVARLRAAPGARDQVVPLLLTSVLIPPLAIGHWLTGWIRHRHAEPWFATPAGRVVPAGTKEEEWTASGPPR